jgi:hypothetical protein
VAERNNAHRRPERECERPRAALAQIGARCAGVEQCAEGGAIVKNQTIEDVVEPQAAFEPAHCAFRCFAIARQTRGLPGEP